MVRQLGYKHYIIYYVYNITYKRRTLEPNTIGMYKGREIIFLDILLYLNA